MSNRWRIAIRMAGALAFVAVTMAVSCPQPAPPGPIPDDGPSETKSPERLYFEACGEAGFHAGNRMLLSFDEAHFQTSTNYRRRSVRIQSDDQLRYLHIFFSDRIPVLVGDEAVCRLSCNPAGTEEMTLFIKFLLIRKEEGLLWLWNEMQKTGAIIHDFPKDLQETK